MNFHGATRFFHLQVELEFVEMGCILPDDRLPAGLLEVKMVFGCVMCLV